MAADALRIAASAWFEDEDTAPTGCGCQRESDLAHVFSPF
jgi:hypothetical protein